MAETSSSVEKLTTQQKLNSLLGISDNETVDDFLSQLDGEQKKDTVSAAMNSIAEKVNNAASEIDSIALAENGNAIELSSKSFSDMQTSLKEIEDLIVLSKQMYKHIYANIVSTDLIDSELIGAAAKMLEAIHINICEFLDVYRERMRFVDKLKVMGIQQQQKIELMELKHKQNIELMNLKNAQGAIDVQEGMKSFDQTEIVNYLDDLEKSKEEINDCFTVKPEHSEQKQNLDMENNDDNT